MEKQQGQCCSKTGTRHTYAAYYVLLESDSNTPQRSSGRRQVTAEALLPDRLTVFLL